MSLHDVRTRVWRNGTLEGENFPASGELSTAGCRPSGSRAAGIAVGLYVLFRRKDWI
jgi:hypothetical protein